MVRNGNSKIKVVAIRYVQHGQEMYLFVMTPELRTQLKVRIDSYNHDTGEGYQRLPDDRRIKKIKDFWLQAKTSVPNGILLNCRSSKSLRFIALDDANDRIGFLEISVEEALWLYDGQHRWSGWCKACDDEQLGTEFDCELAVALTVLPKEDEQIIFLTINQEAKGVDSSLTLIQKHHIFANRGGNEGDDGIQVLSGKLKSDMAWAPNAVEIADLLLNEDSGDFKGNILYNRLTPPNKEKKDVDLCALGTFAKYNKGVSQNNNDQYPESIRERAILLCNYWMAISRLMPDCFEKPRDYVLVKHAGLETMSRLFPKVVQFIKEIHHTAKPSVKQFVDALKSIGGKMEQKYWLTHSNGGKGACGYHGGQASMMLSEEMKKMLYKNNGKKVDEEAA